MYCFNFFRNQLWQHLINYNSLRTMNMCLLEVAMCEKCRSSNFQLEEGESKKFEYCRKEGGGLKNFRTGGGLPIWGGEVILLGDQYTITWNVTLTYLMTIFIVQNLEKVLTADPELWQCTIFGPNMDHLPLTNFFGKLLSFSSTY